MRAKIGTAKIQAALVLHFREEFMKRLFITLLLIGLAVTGIYRQTTTLEGEGTLENPYKVSAIEDLIEISSDIAYWGKHFQQTADDDETATLTIYNLKGQTVKSADFFGAGEHRHVWNGIDDSGKRVASGIYFYKLKTDSYESVRKMIVGK